MTTTPKPRLGQKATIRHCCTGTTARATWNGVGWHCQCGDVVFAADVVGLAVRPPRANQHDTKLTGLSFFQARECVDIAARLGVTVTTTASTALFLRVSPVLVLDAARAHHDSLAGDRGRLASACLLRKLERIVDRSVTGRVS